MQQKVPGAVHAIREYLRVYKTLEGKPENSFALDEEFMPKVRCVFTGRFARYC